VNTIIVQDYCASGNVNMGIRKTSSAGMNRIKLVHEGAHGRRSLWTFGFPRCFNSRKRRRKKKQLKKEPVPGSTFQLLSYKCFGNVEVFCAS
jgi:hypothetical protein